MEALLIGAGLALFIISRLIKPEAHIKEDIPRNVPHGKRRQDESDYDG